MSFCATPATSRGTYASRKNQSKLAQIELDKSGHSGDTNKQKQENEEQEVSSTSNEVSGSTRSSDPYLTPFMKAIKRYRKTREGAKHRHRRQCPPLDSESSETKEDSADRYLSPFMRAIKKYRETASKKDSTTEILEFFDTLRDMSGDFIASHNKTKNKVCLSRELHIPSLFHLVRSLHQIKIEGGDGDLDRKELEPILCNLEELSCSIVQKLGEDLLPKVGKVLAVLQEPTQGGTKELLNKLQEVSVKLEMLAQNDQDGQPSIGPSVTSSMVQSPGGKKDETNAFLTEESWTTMNADVTRLTSSNEMTKARKYSGYNDFNAAVDESTSTLSATCRYTSHSDPSGVENNEVAETLCKSSSTVNLIQSVDAALDPDTPFRRGETETFPQGNVAKYYEELKNSIVMDKTMEGEVMGKVSDTTPASTPEAGQVKTVGVVRKNHVDLLKVRQAVLNVMYGFLFSVVFLGLQFDFTCVE